MSEVRLVVPSPSSEHLCKAPVHGSHAMLFHQGRGCGIGKFGESQWEKVSPRQLLFA